MLMRTRIRKPGELFQNITEVEVYYKKNGAEGTFEMKDKDSGDWVPVNNLLGFRLFSLDSAIKENRLRATSERH